MVLHEEHRHHFQAKSSGSSRSSSKKNKAKKIPQRGLGVAQLEKLRIEEQQQKKTSNTSSSSNPVPPPLVLPVTPPQPQQQRLQPPLPFATPRSHSPLVRSAISSSLLPTVDFFKPDHIGFSASSNAEELKYLSSIWSEDLSNINAAEAAMAEKFAILGANQHQYLSPIRLTSNKAGFIPLSSRVSLQMEPPSNQNYSIGSSQREEERIAGTNLPWPFHPETAVSFPCKAPHFCAPFFRPEELTASYEKSPWKFDYKGPAFSIEGTSRNSEIHVCKRLRENGASADGEFLSLGTSKLKQPILPSRQPEHPEISLLQSQGAVENATKISVNSSRKPFYSFLPMGPTGHEADANEGGVDTSLKL